MFRVIFIFYHTFFITFVYFTWVIVTRTVCTHTSNTTPSHNFRHTSYMFITLNNIHTHIFTHFLLFSTTFVIQFNLVCHTNHQHTPYTKRVHIHVFTLGGSTSDHYDDLKERKKIKINIKHIDVCKRNIKNTLM